MLNPVADGVWVNESGFMQSNAVVVQGTDGVLVIDAGISRDELAHLAADLRGANQTVVAGFSTHPHWDHLLWHAELGDAPRYGTAIAAGAILARLADPDWKSAVGSMIPPDAGEVPLDESFGRITGLPANATEIPWDGPHIRIIEHPGHAPGHAALLIEDAGVLVAGDMLSDVLIPMLNLNGAEDPIGDYLVALELIESVAGAAAVVVPGHGSVGGVGQLGVRLDQDRAYLHAVRAGTEPSDLRLGASAKPGWEWVSEVHAGQLHHLAERKAKS